MAKKCPLISKNKENGPHLNAESLDELEDFGLQNLGYHPLALGLQLLHEPGLERARHRLEGQTLGRLLAQKHVPHRALHLHARRG